MWVGRYTGTTDLGQLIITGAGRMGGIVHLNTHVHEQYLHTIMMIATSLQ